MSEEIIFREYEENDFQAVLDIAIASAEADGTIRIPTEESLKRQIANVNDQVVIKELGFIVAVDSDDRVVGYGRTRWKIILDGKCVYEHFESLHPDHQNVELHKEFISEIRKQLSEFASTHEREDIKSRVFGTSVYEKNKVLMSLLTDDPNYKEVWAQVEMRFDDLAGLEEVEKRDGFRILATKEVTEAIQRLICQLIVDVYTEEGESSRAITDEDLQELVRDHPDPSLWKVLVTDEPGKPFEVVGAVLSVIKDGVAELSELGIIHHHRKKGLGTHVMKIAMLDLKGKGFGSVILETGAEGQHGGRGVYEEIGFKPSVVYRIFESPLDTADQPKIQAGTQTKTTLNPENGKGAEASKRTQK